MTPTTVFTADHVVIATHPDQALELLTDPTAEESRLLGAFEYLSSSTLLHTDSSLLPRATGARASWNYLMDTCSADDRQVNVTYHLNRLQRIDDPVDYLVTLNSEGRVDPATVVAEMTYAHPTYTQGPWPPNVNSPRSIPAEPRLSQGSWRGRTRRWRYQINF